MRPLQADMDRSMVLHVRRRLSALRREAYAALPERRADHADRRGRIRSSSFCGRPKRRSTSLTTASLVASLRGSRRCNFWLLTAELSFRDALLGAGRNPDALAAMIPASRFARTGKILLWDQRDLPCPVPFAKIFLFSPNPNQLHIPAVSSPRRGVSR